MNDPNKYGTWQERILTEKPRQTNADRIRSMTDEELATYYFTEFFGKVPYCHENCPAHDDCQLCLLGWLKQECE